MLFALQDTQHSHNIHFKIINYIIGGDAGVLIATTAASTFTRHVATVVSEDNDALVLLCHHADTQTHELYYR